MHVSDTFNIANMPSYPLRYHKNVAKFLDVLSQLLDIYQTESHGFFRQCIENIPVDIYDKIIELNGSKTSSKYWSQDYMQCIVLSKRLVSAVTYIEKIEYKQYIDRIINYEQHYGDMVIANYTVTITLPVEFDHINS